MQALNVRLRADRIVASFLNRARTHCLIAFLRFLINECYVMLLNQNNKNNKTEQKLLAYFCSLSLLISIETGFTLVMGLSLHVASRVAILDP